MANVFGIHSVGNSIVTFLRNTYPQDLAGRQMPDCEFALVSSGELEGNQEKTTRVTLYLYRVTLNEHARQARPSTSPQDKAASLGLDLHYLLTAWGSTTEDEHVTLAWTMRQLHLYPILDASSLSPEADWAGDEVVQIIPAELSTEDIMRIWDALDPAYHISVSYIARLVRLDPDSPQEERRVVASRYAYGEEEPK